MTPTEAANIFGVLTESQIAEVTAMATLSAHDYTDAHGNRLAPSAIDWPPHTWETYKDALSFTALLDANPLLRAAALERYWELLQTTVGQLYKEHHP